MLLKFETAMDASGNPILTDNNPLSPAIPDGSSGGSLDVSDPTFPPAVFVKVDLVYPSSGPALSRTTLTTGQPLRFWSSDTGGNLIVGGPTERFDLSANPHTTLYAELSDGPGAAIGYATLTYNGAGDAVSPVAVSLSLDNLPANEPTAMIASTEFPPDANNDPQYSILHVATPANLPQGATVSLSVNGDVVSNLDVYDEVPASGHRAIIGRDADGQASFCDWTVGNAGSFVPSTLYVVGLSGTNYQQVKFTLSVSLPGQPNNIITATQAATVPGKGGYLVAFDGTWQKQADDSSIVKFKDNYLGADKDYHEGVGVRLVQLNPLTWPNIIPGIASGAVGGPEASAQVTSALDKIEKFYANPVNHGVPIDLIGWSRGAFEAAKLANLIASGIPDLSRPVTIKGRQTYPYKFSPLIRFVGLISPVRKMGKWIGNWGEWPTVLPAGIKSVWEAGDNAPNDVIFTETRITAAAGTAYYFHQYPHPHPFIGYWQPFNAPEVYDAMVAAASAAGAPI